MKNFFEILEFGDATSKIALSSEEIEGKYCKIQMKLIKNQAHLSADEFQEKLDLINKALSILKDEKSRIDHVFEIYYASNFKQNTKTSIEKEVELDNEFMEYFFEMNEKIDNFFLKNTNSSSFNQDLQKIKDELISKKNQSMVLMDQEIKQEKFDIAYKIFLKMKYFYRALEIIKNKENLINNL